LGFKVLSFRVIGGWVFRIVGDRVEGLGVSGVRVLGSGVRVRVYLRCLGCRIYLRCLGC